MTLSNCNICPRACNANRIAGVRGICTQNDQIMVTRAALHMWEEPPISGEVGSGTVFFAGCSLHCVYCQNQAISNGEAGKVITVERLAEIFMEQQGRGAANINLVTPTHFAPQIKEAIDIARAKGLNLPIVYNTSGYETVEAVKDLKGYVDIFLTDFKYASPELAQKYSKAKDYPDVASKALDAMYDLIGPYVEDDEGMAQKGVFVRHMLLPGQLEDSCKVIDILAGKPYANDIVLSLMSQYTPMPGIEEKFPELGSPVDEDEYDALLDYAFDQGFEDSFCQEGGAASESFIPEFDCEGV